MEKYFVENEDAMTKHKHVPENINELRKLLEGSFQKEALATYCQYIRRGNLLKLGLGPVMNLNDWIDLSSNRDPIWAETMRLHIRRFLQATERYPNMSIIDCFLILKVEYLRLRKAITFMKKRKLGIDTKIWTESDWKFEYNRLNKKELSAVNIGTPYEECICAKCGRPYPPSVEVSLEFLNCDHE
jgi:hypothetical protein